MKYSAVCCGGTFDLLHEGHKNFLEFAANQGEKLVIGLTSDEFLKIHKPGISIQSYKVRKQSIEEFLKSLSFNNFQIIPLEDSYGPAIDSTFDAIVVTEESLSGAEEINTIRISKGLKPLEIIVCPFKEFEKGIISSTQIRSGKITRSGELFVKDEWMDTNLKLPEEVRDAFKKPIGELITDSKNWIKHQRLNANTIITVGDATTELFVKEGIVPQLSIVDLKVQRHEAFKTVHEIGFHSSIETIEVSNPPGKIGSELFQAISDWFDSSKKQTVILIHGEDDLAVLPVLLMSPLGYTIFYGQPQEGIVKVDVTEDQKKHAFQLFLLFDSQKGI